MKRIIYVCIFAEFIQTEMCMHSFIYTVLYYLVLSVICLYVVYPESPVGLLNLNIYILDVFTEKPYSKPLERNVVYIPIITLSHPTSYEFNDVKIIHGSLQSEWTSAMSFNFFVNVLIEMNVNVSNELNFSDRSVNYIGSLARFT